MLAEEIEKAWAARAKSAPFYPTPTFVGDALTLGAGTEIARAKADSPYAAFAKERPRASEARVIALLAAAFVQPPSERALAHLRRALHKRAEGDGLIASIHVALMGLPRVDRGDSAARRLFAADRLMNAGVTPETIFKAIDLDPAALGDLLGKYNADQPRVPEGGGRTSGQWTSEGSYGTRPGSRSKPIAAKPAALTTNAAQMSITARDKQPASKPNSAEQIRVAGDVISLQFLRQRDWVWVDGGWITNCSYMGGAGFTMRTFAGKVGCPSHYTIR